MNNLSESGIRTFVAGERGPLALLPACLQYYESATTWIASATLNLEGASPMYKISKTNPGAKNRFMFVGQFKGNKQNKTELDTTVLRWIL